MNISFVIPAYNCADTIEESIQSIIYGNFENDDEILIINDGSTDNTSCVLEILKKKYSFIKIINNKKNVGCPASRNIGIARSNNPLIFNLDSDNILGRDTISHLKKALIDENADVAAFGEIHFFISNIKKITHEWNCVSGTLALNDFLAGHINPGPAGNFLYTKSSWERIKGYWEYGKGLHEAWGFSLKQITSGSKFIVVPGTYYYHRYGHESLYTRESRVKDESSLMATKMIKPFLHLINKKDAEYILSEDGSKTWFDNLNDRPIRVKSGEVGKTGTIIYRNNYFKIIRNYINKIIIKFRNYKLFIKKNKSGKRDM